MSKPELSRTKTAAALLLAAALCAQGAWAQSGRKGQKTSAPPPAAEPQGESESGPKQDASKKKPDALVSFVVVRGDEGVFTLIDPLARDGVAENFLRRLGASSSISVTNGGAGGRQDARARAKSESEAYVVLFQLEEDSYVETVGRADSRRLVIKTYVYTPKTGDLKYADTVFQRPYRQTARVGGIPIPVPTRGIERYPSQRELELAARDAADRLLSRFHVSPPPDN